MLDRSLIGKSALVTGASSGLGAHFAATLAKAGAKVVIGARRVGPLKRLADNIRAEGGEARPVELDITQKPSVESAVSTHGPFDILVNNAGIAHNSAIVDLPEADWDVVQATNAKGVFLTTQAVARTMIEHRIAGSIINIASILGVRQAKAVAAYASSKAAAIQFIKVAALGLARFGIRVNAIAPGYLATDLNADFFDGEAGKALIKRIPLRRLGRLEELDGHLLLLASNASAYMTGAVIEVDGGYLVGTL